MKSHSAMTDLERNGGEEADLDNHGVVSFTWLKVNVEIGNWASDRRPKTIIDAVDGSTAAGKPSMILHRIRILTKSRRSHGHNGAVWLREDDSAQSTC